MQDELTIPIDGPDDGAGNHALCTGELQAVGEASRAQPSLDESLLCLEDPASLNDETLLPLDYPILSQCRNELLDGNMNAFYGLADLSNVDLGTPPDFQLSVSLSFLVPLDANMLHVTDHLNMPLSVFMFLSLLRQDFQFGSQESIGSWLDRI